MPGVDISCDTKLEKDGPTAGLFTVTLTVKGFETPEHAQAFGKLLEEPVNAALRKVGGKPKIITPH